MTRERRNDRGPRRCFPGIFFSRKRVSLDMIREIKERLGCHHELRVGVTDISDPLTGERLPMLGAFAPQNVTRGDCLGFYTGCQRAVPQSKVSSNRNAFALDDETVIIPMAGELRKGRHPISRVNEPPPRVAANCEFKCWYRVREILPDTRLTSSIRKAAAVSKILLSHLPCPPASVTNPIWCTRSLLSVRRQVTLHATRDLACDEELYALYGAAYGAHRDYPVGVPPAHRLLKSDIQDLQRPAAFPSARLCALEGKQCAVVLIMD